MADDTPDPSPPDPSPIDAAFARLEAALTRLDAVVARRLEAEAEPDDRDAELALMDEDRARLAAVEATTGVVGQRLDRAIQTVQGVLGRA